MAWDRYSLIGGVQIAERFVAAELALARRTTTPRLRRSMPRSRSRTRCPTTSRRPGIGPSRQALGAMLLAAGKPVEAEKAYREELARNPENGWSLYGLAQALKAQGKKAEAQDATDRFARAWANADIDLSKS